MNDRSQAGSALHDGAIEMMQSRRIPYDDARGMSENLEEKDENGKGIRVQATYYIDVSYGESKQRVVQ
jgi:hypothetical protein